MPELELSSERLTLALPQDRHAPAMCDFWQRNREHLAPWSPPPTGDMSTLEYWRDNIDKSQVGYLAGTQLRLIMLSREEPGRVIGSIGFSQIFRGPFCSCMLGYQIDAACEGKGLMREALQTAIRHMFEEQKLHRIGANYMPRNARSGRLLQRLGFRIEGFAGNYLFIDGAWRDHVLTSLVNDGFRPDWLART